MNAKKGQKKTYKQTNTKTNRKKKAEHEKDVGHIPMHTEWEC